MRLLDLGSIVIKPTSMLITMPHWSLLLLGVLATLRLRREATRVGFPAWRAASLPWIAWWVAALITTIGANVVAYAYGFQRGVLTIPTQLELFPLQLFVGLGYLAYLDRKTRALSLSAMMASDNETIPSDSKKDSSIDSPGIESTGP